MFLKADRNRIMVRFSGFESSEASKAVLKLRGGIANNNREATHLVMPTLMRTPKLLCCLPSVKFILSPQWLTDSLEHGEFLDEQPYVLKDTDLERKMNFNMVKLLELPQRDQLFKTKTFYVTPSVVPCRSVLRDVIENSGGKVVSQLKNTKTILELNQKEENSFIIISCTVDFHLLSDVIKHKIGKPFSIVSIPLKHAFIFFFFFFQLLLFQVCTAVN